MRACQTMGLIRVCPHAPEKLTPTPAVNLRVNIEGLANRGCVRTWRRPQAGKRDAVLEPRSPPDIYQPSPVPAERAQDQGPDGTGSSSGCHSARGYQRCHGSRELRIEHEPHSPRSSWSSTITSFSPTCPLASRPMTTPRTVTGGSLRRGAEGAAGSALASPEETVSAGT